MRTEINTTIMAALLGYEGEHRARYARNWLRARGIAMQHMKGGQVFTTDEHLREVAPHLWLKWREAKKKYERENIGGQRPGDGQTEASEDRVLGAFYQAIRGSDERTGDAE